RQAWVWPRRDSAPPPAADASCCTSQRATRSDRRPRRAQRGQSAGSKGMIRDSLHFTAHGLGGDRRRCLLAAHLGEQGTWVHSSTDALTVPAEELRSEFEQTTRLFHEPQSVLPDKLRRGDAAAQDCV